MDRRRLCKSDSLSLVPTTASTRLHQSCFFFFLLPCVCLVRRRAFDKILAGHSGTKWARRSASRFVWSRSLRRWLEFHRRVQSRVVLTDIELHLLFVVLTSGWSCGWVGAVDLEMELEGDLWICLSSVVLTNYLQPPNQKYLHYQPKVDTHTSDLIFFSHFSDYLNYKLSLKESELWFKQTCKITPTNSIF